MLAVKLIMVLSSLLRITTSIRLNPSSARGRLRIPLTGRPVSHLHLVPDNGLENGGKVDRITSHFYRISNKLILI